MEYVNDNYNTIQNLRKNININEIINSI